MIIRILFLITIVHRVVWCQYDLSNVFPGTRMSVNDDMFVSASNAFSNFAVLMHPFRNTSAGGSIRCNMRYYTTDRFVHSVAVVGIMKNSTDLERFMFVFAAERMSTKTPYVCIGTITMSTCASQVQCTDINAGGSQQAYFLIGVDTNGTFAYGFTSSFVFKLDIYQNKILLNLTTDSVWPSAGFIPHGMDVADTWAVVAGYGYADVVKMIYTAQACLINLSVLTNASCVLLTSETTFFIPSDIVSYNELYELSVSIRNQKVLVGVHRLSSVVILQNLGTSLNATHVYTLPYPDASSVGRVVDWADNTTIAVLVQNPSETSYAQSLVFVYDETSVTLTTPLFTFPNNQQILGSRLSRPSFARFGITAGGNMAILTSSADILIIPVAAAGYSSRWNDTTERVFVFYYVPKFCIGGTYKNLSSVGPCQICPPRTYNPGTLSRAVLQCMPCSNTTSTSLCPLASLADIDSSTVPPYSQVVPYPETADTNNIDDILLKNVFQISSPSRCLVVSPLLWTLVVGAICVLIMAIMMVLKQCRFQRYDSCTKKAKMIFKHTDIIGEGEMWVGGLATLAIVVLMSFSYWFSVSFIERYPVEEVSGPATFACDDTLINSQFSTGLELLAMPKSDDSQPIFDLLDQQTFQLTVELINTGFACNTITTQENLSESKHILLPINCSQSTSNAITSVTFPFPRHLTTVQINMTGPYWIGALRLCIRGQGQVQGSRTLRELDFCKFYTTPNEAIGHLTYIPIVFTKNINMTHSLDEAGATLYSGLWMPTFSDVSLSDEEYYVESGNYLRYTSSLTILQVAIDERPFIVKNIEQPIVRTAELIFHGLLFTSLCIELFAFTFLIIKLFILPLIRLVLLLWRKIFPGKKKSHDLNSSLKSNPSTNDDPTSRIEASQTTTTESISSVSNQDQHDEQHECSTPELELNAIHLVTKL